MCLSNQENNLNVHKPPSILNLIQVLWVTKQDHKKSTNAAAAASAYLGRKQIKYTANKHFTDTLITNISSLCL